MGRIHRTAGVAVFAMLVSGGNGYADELKSCLFGTGCLIGAAAPQPAPSQTPPNQASADAAAAKVLAANAVDGDVVPTPAAKAKKVAKPVHAVTIAADPAEVARLKGLVAALPKERIRIVEQRDGAGSARTDFAIKTSLDDHPAGEKARLFTEQLHIVAGAAIKTVADLDGKVVSFGKDDGATAVAARKAFDTLGIKVKETPLDVDNALDGVASGDVDAVVILAPQPVAKLAAIKGHELHLVSWPEGGALPSGAEAATIDIGKYPSLGDGRNEPVRAVGVGAILATTSKTSLDPEARKFLSSIAQHSAELSKHGFDLIKADLESRADRRVASADRR